MVEAWGLTGGVAAGKSQAARIFESLGIPVLDADQVARDLRSPGGAGHAPGAAYAPIVERFGTADPAALREIVFKDPAARAELEGILHPLIRAESARRIAELAAQKRMAAGPSAATSKPTLVIYEAALLVETGRYKEFAGLIVIDASLALRRKRLIARDGLQPEIADRILAAQASDEARRAAATVVIGNDGTADELRARISEWVARRARAG